MSTKAVGLVLGRNLRVAKTKLLGRVALVITPPGHSVTEIALSRQLGLRCLCLSRMLARGSRTEYSAHVAHHVRSIALSRERLTVEELSSVNDIHEYTLINLYLFERAFSEFIAREQPIAVICDTLPYRNFFSPMRQGVGLLFSEARQRAFIAEEICKKARVKFHYESTIFEKIISVFDPIGLHLRRIAFQSVLIINVITKIIFHRSAGSVIGNATATTDFGFVVRTPSEVYSALPIIRELSIRGAKSLVIADELVASRGGGLTLQRLGIPFIKIGRHAGFGAAIRSLTKSIGVVDKERLPSYFRRPGSCGNPGVLLGHHRFSTELWRIASDFALPQRHMAREIDAIICRFSLRHLVTFGYLDQWGFIIREVADRYALPSTTIQNAAVDPDEYPALARTKLHCVESLNLKDLYLRYGISPDALRATGAPFRMAPQVNRRASEWRLNKIVIVTQPIFYEYYEEIIRTVMAFCLARSVALGIKLHPRQRVDAYDAILGEIDVNHIIVRYHHEALDSVIAKSDLIISVTSAAVLTAMEAGTPVLLFGPPELLALDLDFTSDQFVFTFDNMEALICLLKKGVDDPAELFRDAAVRASAWKARSRSIEPGTDPIDNIVSTLECATPFEKRDPIGGNASCVRSH